MFRKLRYVKLLYAFKMLWYDLEASKNPIMIVWVEMELRSCVGIGVFWPCEAHTFFDFGIWNTQAANFLLTPTYPVPLSAWKHPPRC